MKGKLWASLATAAWGCHRQLVYGEAECEMIAITHRFGLYPTKEQEEKLLFILEQCRWLYSYFSIINECENHQNARSNP